MFILDDSDASLGRAVEDMYEDLFESMQVTGFDKATGYDALRRQYEYDLADKWIEWWDEGED